YSVSPPHPSPLPHSPPAPRHLHSFPTRRSSDLCRALDWRTHIVGPPERRPSDKQPIRLVRVEHERRDEVRTRRAPRRVGDGAVRSEEHTSELQSPYDLVCRLLLEKKTNNILTCW